MKGAMAGMLAAYVSVVNGGVDGGRDSPRHLDPDPGVAIRHAVQTVADGVVAIRIVGGIHPSEAATGGAIDTTGVVVHADGWIATSAAYLSGSPAAVLVRRDGKELPARIVSRDRVAQVALIKADGADWPVPRAVSAEAIEPGQYAFALGRGWGGTAPSVSAGIVSAIRRGPASAIQTDAKISPANHGGALVDRHGGVLGVIVPLSIEPVNARDVAAGSIADVGSYDSGIGFAIPFRDLLDRLPRMRRGDLERGVLGVELAAREPFDIDLTVVDSFWRSPADRAGIRQGDRIARVDAIRVRTLGQWADAIGRTRAGDRVRLGIERAGRSHWVEATLAADRPVWPPRIVRREPTLADPR